jgi:hypothetical protein
LIEKFVNGNGLYDVGPYWQQPGRSILQNHLREIVYADPSLLTDSKYLVFSGDWYPESKHPSAEVRRVIMSMPATLEGLEGNLRTWSSVHTYLEKFPDVAAMRGKGTEGDVVDQMISKLKAEGVPEDGAFTVDTAMVLLLYRKHYVQYIDPAYLPTCFFVLTTSAIELL